MDTFAKNGFFLLNFKKQFYRMRLSCRIVKRSKGRSPSEGFWKKEGRDSGEEGREKT